MSFEIELRSADEVQRPNGATRGKIFGLPNGQLAIKLSNGDVVTGGASGGGSLAVQDEGGLVEAAATALNFVGPVQATTDGAGTVTVTFPSMLQLSSLTPSALGAASAGTSGAASPGDHVHPMPTAAQVGVRSFTKVAVFGQTTVTADNADDTLTLISGANVSIVTSPVDNSVTISAPGAGPGSAPVVVQDEGTNITSALASINFTGAGVTATATGGAVTVNIATSATPANAAPPAIAASSSVGTPTGEYANENHTHAHGDQAGGSLHALATPSASGFMSGGDKSKLNSIAAGATNTPISTADAQALGPTALPGTTGTAADAGHVHPRPSLAELGAQAALVSGGNIKTINGNSILGSGDLTIAGGGGGGSLSQLQQDDFGAGYNGPFTLSATPLGDVSLLIDGIGQKKAERTQSGTTVTRAAGLPAIGPDESVSIVYTKTSASTTQLEQQDFAAGSNGPYTLTYAPVGDVQLQIDGITQKKADRSVSGSTVTRTVGLPAVGATEVVSILYTRTI